MFCVLYAVVALPVHGPERFPLFAWQLFVRVPAVKGHDYSVRLLEVNGRTLGRPVYFEKADSYLSGNHSVTAQFSIRRLALAVQRHAPKTSRLRAQFEEVFLAELGSARYQVVRRTFDIRTRRSCDCFEKQVPLATFTLP